MSNNLSDNKRSFFAGALISYLTIAFNVVSGLLYTPWMIRSIGDDQYALYTLALSVINIFLLDFGIGASVSKFLSAFYAEGRYDDANRFMGIVYKVFGAISLVIALALTVFYFLIDAIYVKLTPNEIIIFKRLFIIVSTYSVLSFPFTTFNSLLMANERFFEVKICNLLSRVLSVAMIVVCLLLNKGVYSLVIVNALVNFLTIGVKLILIKRNTPQRSDLRAWDRQTTKQLFSFTVWVAIKDIAHRCIFTIMPTIIAAILGSAEVTLFNLAATLEGYVYTFADAVNGMFMPKITKLTHLEQGQRELSKLMIKVGKYHIFSIGLIFAGFFCVGETFVGLWLGDGYESVYLNALILIFPSLIDVPQQIAKTTLIVKDRVKEQAIVYTIVALTNVLLAIVFLKLFGIIGASLAVFVAYTVRTVGMNILYKKYLKIDLRKYFVSVYGRWVVVFSATLLFGVGFSKLVGLSGMLSLLCTGAVVVAVYTVLYLLLCVDLKSAKVFVLSHISRK